MVDLVSWNQRLVDVGLHAVFRFSVCDRGGEDAEAEKRVRN